MAAGRSPTRLRLSSARRTVRNSCGPAANSLWPAGWAGSRGVVNGRFARLTAVECATRGKKTRFDVRATQRNATIRTISRPEMRGHYFTPPRSPSNRHADRGSRLSRVSVFEVKVACGQHCGTTSRTARMGRSAGSISWLDKRSHSISVRLMLVHIRPVFCVESYRVTHGRTPDSSSRMP